MTYQVTVSLTPPFELYIPAHIVHICRTPITLLQEPRRYKGSHDLRLVVSPEFLLDREGMQYLPLTEARSVVSRRGTTCTSQWITLVLSTDVRDCEAMVLTMIAIGQCLKIRSYKGREASLACQPVMAILSSS